MMRKQLFGSKIRSGCFCFLEDMWVLRKEKHVLYGRIIACESVEKSTIRSSQKNISFTLFSGWILVYDKK